MGGGIMAEIRLMRFGPVSVIAAAAVAFEAFIADSMSLVPEIPLRRIASLLCKSAIKSPAGAVGALIAASFGYKLLLEQSAKFKEKKNGFQNIKSTFVSMRN